jgi:hypothetical protein
LLNSDNPDTGLSQAVSGDQASWRDAHPEQESSIRPDPASPPLTSSPSPGDKQIRYARGTHLHGRSRRALTGRLNDHWNL